VEFEDYVYPSVEHAYQAAKTLDPKEREYFLQNVRPGLAKLKGKEVTLRPDWDSVKLKVMYDLVKQKFSTEPTRTMLLNTGDAELIEGNTWGDTFWGVFRGRGENHLGKILMQVRNEL
jgi:ribA/ribD-fused uncharacterized protein